MRIRGDAHFGRRKAGALVLDLPRFAWWLNRSWIRICNRHERLRLSPDRRGVACEWRWASDLHVTSVFPGLGRRLLERATRQWPIALADVPPRRGGDVQVSFVLGHRGPERVPQLLATLGTIAAQQGIACECIVVEQSVRSELPGVLPRWVRHLHTPLPDPGLPYCRAWALNVGGRAARGKLLVFHDNDMLVSKAYAAELWARYRDGYEVINLKRFVFYLTAEHSREVASIGALGPARPPEAIVQNAEAGGSVAVANDVFLAVGGYDESFVGWGGEDNELWERLQLHRVWPYAYLPFVHLWHAAQPEKLHAERLTAEQFRRRSELSPERRVAELTMRDFGNPARMDPRWSPVATESSNRRARTRDDG